MARQLDPTVVEAVVRALEKHSDGATIDQMESTISLPRRTLQRRLAELVTAGRVRTIGRGKLQ